MQKPKLIRITTVPLSLEKLLEGQLSFMKDHFEVIAVSSDKERLKRFGKKEGLRVFNVELTRKITPLKDLKALYKLYRFFKEEKPDIVHTHTPKAGIIGMTAAYFARVPIRLHTVAGLPLMEASGMKRFILNSVERATYRYATKVYPNSRGLMEFILKEKFTKPNKLKIIGSGSSNGIDTRYFSPAHFSEDELKQKRAELKIPEADFVFVFVGRIVRDKGVNELVSAFSRLRDKYSDVSLLLVGPFENDLDPLLPVTNFEIEKNEKIICTGFVSDVRPYFALSDVLAFPSYREGFPNVVMQACAMEIPAIVSDINGCNEIVTNGENGRIIPVKDSEALLAAMQKMIEDDNLYKKIKGNSRKRIKTEFEQKEIWSLLLKEYNSLKS